MKRSALALVLALLGFLAVLASPALQARGPAPITDIGAVQLPPEAKHVLILADNDPSGAGLRAAETLLRRLKGDGRRAAIVLPPAGEREFGSREMLYTAITRAKESLLLLMPEGPLEERWLRASERKSGLVGRLHG